MNRFVNAITTLKLPFYASKEHLNPSKAAASVALLFQIFKDRQIEFNNSISVNAESSCQSLLRLTLFKGGDPAAPSGTATLLRLHPSHEAHRGRRLPFGWANVFW